MCGQASEGGDWPGWVDIYSFIQIADPILYPVYMSPVEGVAPGKLRETGDDESGSPPSSRPPAQGMLFCLPISHHEFPVLSPASGPHIAHSPLDLWA